MMNENYLLCVLLEKESTSPILWEPYMLPAPSAVSHSCPISLKAQTSGNQNGCCIHNKQKEISPHEEISNKVDDLFVKKTFDEAIALNACPVVPLTEPYEDRIHHDLTTSDVETVEIAEDEDELPVGLNVDSGSLACVACGTLGYPFMAVIQPSVKAAKMIFSITSEESHEKSDKSRCLISPLCLQIDACNSTTEERCTEIAEQANLYPSCQLFPKSIVTSQHSMEHDMPLPMDNGSFLNYFSMDSLQNKGGTLDTTDSQNKSTFCSSGLRPCGSVKEFEGIWRTKTCRTVENGFSYASGPFFEGDEESYGNENVGVSKWDVSNVLLRPRVFCLQHAIEVEELLHNKGGGHIRVTCHSDYLKFKAYAASIAEEMGTELHLKDVPLENASQEDLNLINISIDDEEHQEDGKDWTSKLGVNLRYSVKLRKHSTSQEQLPSALQRLFSNPSTVSAVSNLRWLRRKSRTPAKPGCIIVEKPPISATLERGVQTLKVADNDNIKAIQVYQSRKKKTNYLASEDIKQNSEVVTGENVENLFNVPISMIENHEISQNSIERRNSSPSVADISTTESSCFQLSAKSSTESRGVNDRCFSRLNRLNNTTFISVPVNYQYNQVYNNTLTSNSSVLYNEEKNAGESCTDSDGRRHENLELQDNMPLTESKSSDTISEPKFHDSISPSSEYSLLLISDEDEQMLDSEIAEERNVKGSPILNLLAEDHAYAPQSFSVDSEIIVEPSIIEELSSANCFVHHEGEQCGLVSTKDEMDKTASRAIRESILEGELGQICSKTSLVMHECAVDNGKPQHKPCATNAADFVPFTEENVLQKLVDSPADTNFTETSAGNDCSPDVFVARDEGRAVTLNIKSYVRRKNKRKREAEQRVSEEHMAPENTAAVQNKLEIYNKIEAQQRGFARSPCEGLRPRKGKLESYVAESKVADRRTSTAEVLHTGRKKSEPSDAFECDIEGCRMMFRTRSELRLHKRNRCTYDECRKRFSNHKYVMRHQRVHIDERPLRCSWKGCKMSFKWEWARTEHLRLHTGERPYKCVVAGCGLSFRFVSDFSRHRRKSGHVVSTNGS